MSEIETLEDWNARLACCCTMPGFGPPRIARKRASVTTYHWGHNHPPESDKKTIYRTKIRTRITSTSYPSGSDDGLCGDSFGTSSYEASQIDTEEYARNYTQSTSCESMPDPVKEDSRTGSGLEIQEGYQRWCVYCDGELFSSGVDNEDSVTVTTVWDPDHYAPGSGAFLRERVETSRSWTHTCEGDSGPVVSVLTTNTVTSGPIAGATSDTTTYDNGQGYDAWIAERSAAANAAADAMDMSCYSNEITTTPLGSRYTLKESPGKQFIGGGSGPLISYVSIYMRWFIPAMSIPAGVIFTYLKITWDLAFYPAGGGSAEIISTDHTVEIVLDPPGGTPPDTWHFQAEIPTGSRSGWWVGDWAKIPSPVYPGITRPVNIRYVGYRETPYGTPPPQITGDAVPLPPP